MATTFTLTWSFMRTISGFTTITVLFPFALPIVLHIENLIISSQFRNDRKFTYFQLIFHIR